MRPCVALMLHSGWFIDLFILVLDWLSCLHVQHQWNGCPEDRGDGEDVEGSPAREGQADRVAGKIRDRIRWYFIILQMGNVDATVESCKYKNTLNKSRLHKRFTETRHIHNMSHSNVNVNAKKRM